AFAQAIEILGEHAFSEAGGSEPSSSYQEPSLPLLVRSVARADFPQWLPLWEGYNTFYKRIAPADVTKTTWGRFFDSYEPVHAAVAEQDGALLGIVHYLFHRN